MVVDGVLEWLCGAAAGQLLSSHFLLLLALVLPTLRAAWQDGGGEGVADKGVGGGSTQVSVTHSQQLRLETQFWCSALLCFALVLWFAPTISSWDEIAG